MACLGGSLRSPSASSLKSLEMITLHCRYCFGILSHSKRCQGLITAAESLHDVADAAADNGGPLFVRSVR